jgi:acetyl-CoA carboxylase biotin carboxyl carrier protein
MSDSLLDAASAIPVGADPTDEPASPDHAERSAEPAPGAAATGSRVVAGDTSLLALVDRLAAILDRSDLLELEVQAGGTGLVLRKAEALGAATAVGSAPTGPAGSPAARETAAEAAGRPSVKAPLTGIWYSAPAPGTAPFVEVGREVAAGQVIGLIEAMKLFNEIKSDLDGRVVKVMFESGQLVKAKQPLIEVEPL